MPSTRHRRHRSPRLRKGALQRVSEDALLDTRLCDLPITLSDGPVHRGINRLRDELRSRGLRFSPHFWLSDQWFSPEGVPGVAVPFYLGHPRLRQMERLNVGVIDGETFGGVMRLLRHETAHAIDHAYHLHRRRSWQAVFGKSSEPYPRQYRPNPFDCRYVVHLDEWYAQSHPDEDFAETFAVWLTPGANWRRRYRDWPALVKLEYVDRLMTEIKGHKPAVRTRIRSYPLSGDRRTLREHYLARKAEGVYQGPEWYDADLTELFGKRIGGVAVEAVLRQHRRDMMRRVRPSCGIDCYNFEQVFQEFILRCRALGLRTARRWPRLEPELVALLNRHARDTNQARRRVIPV